jgi:hypothetical protein
MLLVRLLLHRVCCPVWLLRRRHNVLEDSAVDILFVHTIPEAVFLSSHTDMARGRLSGNCFTARRLRH